jgi:hypothetical protein
LLLSSAQTLTRFFGTGLDIFSVILLMKLEYLQCGSIQKLKLQFDREEFIRALDNFKQLLLED